MDCPRFCPDCPMVPEGVTATLTDAQVVSWGELRHFRFANDAPQVAEPFVGQTRIYTRVVESRRPDIDVSVTAQMLVSADGKGYDELKKEVVDCSGPVFTRLQKIFARFLRVKVRGRCRAINNSSIVYE